MTLSQKLRQMNGSNDLHELRRKYGILGNPFPASNQFFQNDHFRLDADDKVENYISEFVGNRRSRAIVIKGTQGVGKTNFMRYFESEIQSALQSFQRIYVVKYVADPEASFSGTTRKVLDELGNSHLSKLTKRLCDNGKPIGVANNLDVRVALKRLCQAYGTSVETNVQQLFMQWIRGSNVLKEHRVMLGVQFRLDTVESTTAALRDLVCVSAEAKVLGGVFLLLDELEKQDGALRPMAVVRYLSALRAIIDALNLGLFLMIAITPDALIRYSAALPALRGRLENQVELFPLKNSDQAVSLASYYLDNAKAKARVTHPEYNSTIARDILSREELETCFVKLWKQRLARADDGVRQREYLHKLHELCESRIRESG